MLCRIVNDQPAPCVVYNIKGRPTVIDVAATVDIEIDPFTYERHRTLALVKQGPQIEVLREDEGAEVTVEEDQPAPLRGKLPRRRRKRRKLRLPEPSPVIEVQEGENG